MRALADDIPYVCLPAPGVLLFGDVPQRRALLADAIMRVGGRVVASGPLSAALDRLDRRTASVVIDIGPDDGRTAAWTAGRMAAPRSTRYSIGSTGSAPPRAGCPRWCSPRSA